MLSVNTVSATCSVFPCSSTDSFHKVQFFKNRLLQSKYPIFLPENLLPCGLLWAAVPATSLVQNGLSTGCSSLQGTSTCSNVKSSTACRVEILPTVILQQAAGDRLPHHGLSSLVLQGNLCPGTQSTSLSLLLHSSWCLAGLFLSHLFYSLSSEMQHRNFPPKHAITDLHATWLISLALASAGPILELVESGSVLHCGANPLTSSHRDQSSPPKPCLGNQIQ